MSEKTIFEKVVSREIPGTFIYEDEKYAVIKNINPEAPIHYLAIPKKAVPAITDLKQEDLHIPGDLIKVAKEVLKKENIENFKLIFNGGKYLHLPEHLHLHIVAGEDLEN